MDEIDVGGKQFVERGEALLGAGGVGGGRRARRAGAWLL
jgi:hypothetical protein